MNRAILSIIVLAAFGFQPGCGDAGNQTAVSAKPHASSDKPVIQGKPDPGKITLALVAPTDPKNVKPGALLDLVCRVDTDPGGWEPDSVMFQISAVSKKKALGPVKISFGGTRATEFVKEGRTTTFTAKLEAPKQIGAYVIDARAFGFDPRITYTGPPLAPAADGTPTKKGTIVEVPGPTLEIKVIKEKPPA